MTCHPAACAAAIAWFLGQACAQAQDALGSAPESARFLTISPKPATVAPIPRSATVAPSPTIQPPPPPPVYPSEEIYNTLRITEEQQYCNGNGDAWAGRGVFGELYDLQVVDDIVFAGDCCLDAVIRDYVTFYGATPADGTYVALYPLVDECTPAEQALVEADRLPMKVAHFTDTVFGLMGVRGTVQTDGSLCAPAERYFLETQPHDESNSADWYFVLRDCNSIDSSFSYRDGGRARGGYGTTTWEIPWSPGTVAMAVRAECGPPRPRCIYRIIAAKGRYDPCRQLRCWECSYWVGGLVCAGECPGGGDDCLPQLVGFEVCSNGAVCKVRAEVLACDTPPLYCRRCR